MFKANKKKLANEFLFSLENNAKILSKKMV
jgi:hypothetical protein